MRDLDAPLDFDLRIDRSDPSGRILPIIHYFIRERTDQTTTDDSQTSILRVVHPMGHSYMTQQTKREEPIKTMLFSGRCRCGSWLFRGSTARWNPKIGPDAAYDCSACRPRPKP